MFLSPLFSLLHASSFLNLKKSSLSPLSFSCPHSSTSKKMQTRERKKMERERERRVYGRKKKNR
jgi:hypothetical protein